MWCDYRWQCKANAGCFYVTISFLTKNGNTIRIHDAFDAHFDSHSHLHSRTRIHGQQCGKAASKRANGQARPHFYAIGMKYLDRDGLYAHTNKTNTGARHTTHNTQHTTGQESTAIRCNRYSCHIECSLLLLLLGKRCESFSTHCKALSQTESTVQPSCSCSLRCIYVFIFSTH